MHTAKDKRKSRPPRWYWAKWIFVVGFVGVVVFFTWWFLSPMPTENEIKTSLDAALVPTAEYLLEHPQSEFEGLSLKSWSYSFDNTSQWYQGQICINMVAERSRGDLRGATEIYLNNSPVRFSFSWDAGSGLYYGDAPRLFEWVKRCNAPDFQLPSGIYLLEVRMKYHWYDEPFHIQKWAFEIK